MADTPVRSPGTSHWPQSPLPLQPQAVTVPSFFKARL
jgi:hypothetical protein